MADILELNPGSLLVSQDELYEESIEKFLKSHILYPEDILVPVKEVEGFSEKYALMDGHSRAAVMSLFYENRIERCSFYGWVVKFREDFIPTSLPLHFHDNYVGILEMNGNIYRRFKDFEEVVLDMTIRELRDSYFWMRSPEKLRRHFEIKLNY